ncbi:MAG: Leucine efflux protein [SAR92 bacterium MED-G29]|jgi:threonine/homoserine/homoserine lactone efflux protein|nr:MAG: Leucine efflux protein [SAR92 bacterium MED-G29]|tara:strand:+ start:2254 stop:2811 length:558 start_codon:yes stop_codon:yes gene_type:complete
MTALVARTVSSGSHSGFALLVGIILGDLIYLNFAVFGLTAIAENFNLAFMIIKWSALIYLCYLGWFFWNADFKKIQLHQESQNRNMVSACLSGLSITMGNPKTITFYLALLPVVIDLQTVSIQSLVSVLVPATILILLTVGSIFIISAAIVRQTLSTQKAQKIMYRGAASTMFFAAGTMASREIG